MPVVRFLGRVLPDNLKVSFVDSQRTNWGSDDLGFPIIMQARIKDSQIEVRCEVDRCEEHHVSRLLARAYNLVNAYVDAAVFSTGLAMFADLNTFVGEDNQLLTVSLDNSADMAPLCTAFKFPSTNPVDIAEFEKVMTLILGEPELLGSINDLAQTLLFFHSSPTNCGRVLDSLRRAVAPSLKPKQGWGVLREIVNCDENYMFWVSEYSHNPRHGDRTTDIDRGIIDEIRKRTWNVMNRMLEYRKGGNAPLDKSKFTPLVHDPAFPFPTP
jgi:hypothetical protein